MRLKITHTTEYVYDEPMPYALQRLRLTPQTGPCQTVEDWDVSVDGATVEVSYDDHFGNRVALVETEGPQRRVKVVAGGLVITEDRAGVVGPHTGSAPLWLFLRETPLTKPGKLVRELAKASTGNSELERLHDLMEKINSKVEYVPGSTDTETTAELALEAGKGVCQDHAHILISAARLMGLPARYVSGYLMMEDVAEQTATHAWAEVHLQGLGWVGFDAANNICPDDRYVRIALGLCYRDCAPISGMRIGPAGETLNVSVTVQQSQSQSQS
ncbi:MULTISPECIES: transglutaminase family protein [Agrobacterium]|jgi:transglutaminase-like putative cysteine protease|uniref:transglutaminase family protein n=1 Tax=Agrobacterium TaxID=357 RepID=UPI000DCF840F|nr:MULTISPECIES: transglutaminase family protein [Agrobacterium]MBO9109432.1 transglutaminase family protein [Agrobacterium sp. S2/73]NTA16543.1 transglutaminase family protein [Agrobacterium tumefaciens]NTA81541.1 transglutaminase family protein [Agrobacterium tumefaciens]QXZ72845.1 transglutaminase family protein [Agrobacterium sp. S7/73]UXS96997.1 transglutaminase family protein [Agrobacterium tumefaciens]